MPFAAVLQDGYGGDGGYFVCLLEGNETLIANINLNGSKS
jgi:hypothetical protein